jgi:spermidine synthase
MGRSLGGETVVADAGENQLGRRPFVWITVALPFVGSGAAALIYEVVWFHLLRQVIGASTISLGILLASFMGGMCLGSWLLPIVVPTRLHPLRVYAALELAIGAIGGTLPWWLPRLGDWYLAVADESLTGISARAFVAAIALLPPTMLMGGTLPAIARWVKATPEGLSKLSVFYGANIFGAVIGCLLAGFVLLPQTDTAFTSHVAAAINFAVAAAAATFAVFASYTPDAESADHATGERTNATATICIVAALSGFTALSAEVIWTRLLALLFGSTVYTFAIILAVFLTGLGIGSMAAAWASRWMRLPILWLAGAQLAIVLLVPYANYKITRDVPYRARPAVENRDDIYRVFAHDTRRATAAILLPALFWGASFPLALAAAGRGRGDTGRLVGQIYAANTLGAIVGALLTVAVLVPWIGTQRTQQLLVIVAGLAVVLALEAARRSANVRPETGVLLTNFARLAMPIIAAIAVLCVVAPPKGMFSRALHPILWKSYYDYLFVREGRAATVAVEQFFRPDHRYLCVGGKVEASNCPPDLRNQRLLGHLAALMHPGAKKTLTVGLGTGTTAGCFVLHPEVEEIDICEIEPVVRDAAQFFAVENHGVVDDPRTTIHFDDARHFLATTDEKFDVITSDPINSWIRGAAALYSREYYELCRAHLNPGGIMVQWIPLYEKDAETAKCELATFLEVFPNTTLWTSWTSRENEQERHDVIAIGRTDATPIDLAELERRIAANPRVKAALEEVNLGTIPELMGQFAGRGEDVRPWLDDAEINRDLSLRLEYLAGLSLWTIEAKELFGEIVAFRRYPNGSITGDAPYREEIVERLERREKPAAEAAETPTEP